MTMEAVRTANNSHTITQRKMNYNLPFMPDWGGVGGDDDDDDDESSLLGRGAVSVILYSWGHILGWGVSWGFQGSVARTAFVWDMMPRHWVVGFWRSRRNSVFISKGLDVLQHLEEQGTLFLRQVGRWLLSDPVSYTRRMESSRSEV